MKTDIYFVRHGESTANKDKICAGYTDVELTQLGERQADQAGDELAQSGVKIDKIISSPLKRAYNTAIAIAKKIDYDPDDIVISDLAIERFRGKYEGRPSSEQYDASEDDYARMGAESVDEMIKRTELLGELIDTLEVQTVLVVSHNQFGYVFVAVIRGEPVSRKAELRKLPNAHVFKI